MSAGDEDQVPLQVKESGNAYFSTATDQPKRQQLTSIYDASQWGCFQWTLLSVSWIIPTLFLVAVYCCNPLSGHSIAQVSVSATIGNPNALWLSVPSFFILCFAFMWVTLIRNVQIRVIYDRLECFNIPRPDDPDKNTKELTDYISSCCRTGCGAPIYHNRVKEHNQVNSFKYYFITLRGLNFLTTITNILGWIVVALVSVVTVQEHSNLHLLVVCIAAVLIYFYQFIHGLVLYRQRKVEYELHVCPMPISERRRCRWILYFWDVIFCFVIALASLLCLVLFLYGQGDKQSVIGEVRYKLEWAWFTLFVAYYLIFLYLFCFDNVLEELHEYSHFARHFCFF